MLALASCSVGTERIPDPDMRGGVALLAPQPENGVGVKIDTLRFDDNRQAPVWRLCSWNFATRLSGQHSSVTKDGITYADDTFSLARNRKGTFTMQVDASKVYTQPRSASSDPWINFLVETDFDGLVLGEVRNMLFSYDLRILRCINRTGDPYDTTIHAAQCLGYLHVRNTNPASSDCGKCIWIGMGCYDNRCPGGLTTQSATMWDIGTSTYIYCPAGTEVFGAVDLNRHQWQHARVDVRKTVEDAIASLTENGFLTHSTADDFTIEGMNFGWELPGTFDVCCQFRDFSIVTANSRGR